MNSREQALRKRIEDLADNISDSAGDSQPDFGGKSEQTIAYESAIAMGNSLLPLLLEMAATLEKYKHISLQKGTTHYSEAAETLAALDRFLSGGDKP